MARKFGPPVWSIVVKWSTLWSIVVAVGGSDILEEGGRHVYELLRKENKGNIKPHNKGHTSKT